MDIRQLRYFVAVAEAGHVTQAAALLGIKQPPLSQQIMALEAQLGVTLFVRHPKGMILTDVGLAVLKEVKPLLKSFDAMQQRIAALVEGTGEDVASGPASRRC